MLDWPLLSPRAFSSRPFLSQTWTHKRVRARKQEEAFQRRKTVADTTPTCAQGFVWSGFGGVCCLGFLLLLFVCFGRGEVAGDLEVFRQVPRGQGCGGAACLPARQPSPPARPRRGPRNTRGPECYSGRKNKLRVLGEFIDFFFFFLKVGWSCRCVLLQLCRRAVY